MVLKRHSRADLTKFRAGPDLTCCFPKWDRLMLRRVACRREIQEASQYVVIDAIGAAQDGSGP